MAARRAPLGELFEPRSVAVVGASNRPGSVGASLFRNILAAGFTGAVYPVNPNWPSVSGVRCYPTVRALPEVPDLGVVIVPAPRVATVVEALGRRGTRGVVVISSGFGEVGGDGTRLEAELVRVVHRYRMSLIGPNCFGLLNTDPSVRLNATFSEGLPERGNIGFISQSGALCAGILRYGHAERIGFSRFLSVGNRAGIDENDLLLSLGRDPSTSLILLYMESLADGRRFLDTAREVTERKPVLIIKSGRSLLGEKAARSHTGSLARSAQDHLFDGLFEQAGVLRAESIGELFRTAKIFSTGLRLAGPRLAILTNSGGPGIVAADACARSHLELPPLPDAVADELRPQLSPSATIANPLDLTADAKAPDFRTALQALVRLREVDGALVIATPTGEASGEMLAEAILVARGRSTKPLAACLFGLTDLSDEVRELEAHLIPTFTFPEEAVAGLASLARYQAWWSRPRLPVRKYRVAHARVHRLLAEARRVGPGVLPEYLARGILEGYGFRFPGVRRVRTDAEALAAAEELGYPVVLKVVSPDLPHKTDVGGVALDLQNAASLASALGAMRRSLGIRAPRARIEGFELERMVRGGKEVLLGLHRDSGFGPVLAFGTGGIYVEVLRDVTFRLAPMRPLSARNMVQSSRIYPLLTGVRGEPPSDLLSLYEALERLSQLAVELPAVAELDINPLLVLPAGQGVVAVDARIVLSPAA